MTFLIILLATICFNGVTPSSLFYAIVIQLILSAILNLVDWILEQL